jgi:hypothetical protein
MDAKQEFIDRVDRLELRYKGRAYKHVDSYLMPRELMVQMRDEMVWERQFICKRCGLREELGIKIEPDF